MPVSKVSEDRENATYFGIQVSDTEVMTYEVTYMPQLIEFLVPLSKYFNLIVYTSDFSSNTDLIAT